MEGLESSVNWLERVKQRFCMETYHIKDKKYQIRANAYQTTGNVALQLFEDGEPYASITVNIGKLPDGQFLADVNNFWEVEEFLRKFEIAEPMYKWIESGFCRYPVYRLNRRFTDVRNS